MRGTRIVELRSPRWEGQVSRSSRTDKGFFQFFEVFPFTGLNRE